MQVRGRNEVKHEWYEKSLKGRFPSRMRLDTRLNWVELTKEMIQ